MFNPTLVVIEAFLQRVEETYLKTFGDNLEDICLVLPGARHSLEIIANSDAPYHDVNHTMMVTMVGLEVLRGKIQIEGDVSSMDWVHFLISLLNHDIGFVRGICRADRNGRYAISKSMETVVPPPGATDAFLTPYHVDRAKLFISERFGHDHQLDADTIIRNIERTRFPVPSGEDHKASADMPGLLRAADLIGQLADPHYMRKISALFAEFAETGQAAKMGYETAADLRAGYPSFFWAVASPFINDGLRYLRRTQEGQKWVANLYAHVFAEEHEAPAFGPERRLNPDRRDVSRARMFQINERSSTDRRNQNRRVSDSDIDVEKAG
jgi:hypothetical protein